MLDDKDVFINSVLDETWCEKVTNQVNFWLNWTPWMAGDTTWKRFREMKGYVKFWAPWIDHELVNRGLLPYYCSENCEKKHG